MAHAPLSPCAPYPLGRSRTSTAIPANNDLSICSPYRHLGHKSRLSLRESAPVDKLDFNVLESARMSLGGSPDAFAGLIRYLIEAAGGLGQAGSEVGALFADVPILLGGAIKQIDPEEQAELFNGLREVFPEFVESRNSSALVRRLGLTTRLYPEFVDSRNSSDNLARLGITAAPNRYLPTLTPGAPGFASVNVGGFSPIGVALGMKGNRPGAVSLGLLSVESASAGKPWALLLGPDRLTWTDVSLSAVGTLKPKTRVSDQ